MALTRLGTDQIADSAITNAKISASADIAGSKLEDDMTYGSNLTVSGNLVVNGTTTTVDTTNMSIEDPLLVFSSGASGSASVDAGFVVERGDDTNVGLIWDESADKFNFVTTNETGSTAGNVTVAGQANIIAGNIEGTITTAAQNSITSATGLVSVGAIGTGSWAATDVAVAHGGTGSSTAGGARTNLGVVIGTDVQAYDAELAAIAGLTSAANKGIQFTGDGTAAVYDLTAAGKALLDDANAAAQLVTLGVTATAAEITAAVDGSTSATSTTLADADRVVVNDNGTMVQVALTDFETYFEAGLDTLNAVTSASALATVGTITGGTWAATDVAVAHGGTGSSTAGGARTNLGVVIGTDVQAYDAELAAIAGLTSAADKGIQFTGSGTAAVYDLTAAGKALLDDANAAAQLVTLGVTATAAEITASIDGDTSATATTLADADRVVVNDGGTMKQVALTDFETYFEAGLDTLNAVTSASSLATVGTIGTGVWEATDVAVAHGGTGASSLTANSLLTGNGTAAIQAEANITYDGTTFGVNDAATFNEGGADNDFRIESANQANMFVVDASVDAIGLLTATPNAGTVLDMSGSTESFLLPSGTTAQRPGTPAAGMFRYNSTTSKFEYYNGSGWKGATTEFTIVRSETATGDGSTTAFTGLNSSLTTAGCVVTINGVVQLPTTAYAISGTTITFTQAPANSDKIEIREFTTTTSVNALEDADGDTKIQVEESSDEDIIRFDTGGTERMTLTAAGHLVPTLDATYDLGTSSLKWRNMYGVSTSAQYADLAELYESDATYEPGTVVSFGGDAEVTMSTETMDSRIAGVVSTNPAYLMNSDLENGVAIALTGRVPVKVMGTIRKGDMLVAAGEGYAKAEANPRMGSVIGKALEDFNGTNGIIEVVVGRL